MNIELKQYQETAVDQLTATVKELLTKDGMKKVCVFQAPTGSGKTIMTAKFIRDIATAFLRPSLINEEFSP